MKKRTIISIVITILCIALTNRFWFCLKPLQISFNAEYLGNTRFEFFLNKKDNNDFKKVKYGVVETNLDETNFVELFIDRVHNAKKVKIVVNTEIPPERLKSFVLSEIQLRYGKYKLDDLKAFSIDGGKLKIQGDKLVIYPESDTFSLIYNKPVNVKSPTKFDIKLLIVIAVLSFLLAYKLTSYLADFKTLNNASRMDIVFLLLFFAILFIPMSNIDKKTVKSEKENRNLAKYKPFIYKNSINFNFGNDFDNWFSDRFFTRQFILDSYINTRFNIAKNYFSQNNSAYINKNNNWMYFHLRPAPETFSDEELDSYAYNVQKFKDFCDKNNIKLYIILAPSKHLIYKKEAYPFIGTTQEEKYAKVIHEYIYKKTGVKVIYPYKELKEQSTNDYVFYKTDHHWTFPAGYTAYKILMQEIKKDFKNVQTYELNDFVLKESKIPPKAHPALGGQYTKLGLNNQKIFNVNYKYFEPKTSKNIIAYTDFKLKPKRNISYYYFLNNDNYTAPSIVVLGDSFGQHIAEFLKYSFSKTLRIFTSGRKGYFGPNIKTYEQKIVSSRPDILIICLNQSGIGLLNDFYKKK